MSEIVNVFFSHKAQDAAAARKIAEVLEGRSGRLKVSLFEKAPAGHKYEDWIEGTLAQSDMLLLLYTDPTAEWDWCLYEAGLFTPLRSDIRRPVVCLYDPASEPPKPLRRLNGVRAEPGELVEKFLAPLFRTSDLVEADPPLNPRITDDALQQDAETITAQLLPQKLDTRFYLERIRLTVANPREALRQRRLPDETTVEVLDGSLELLDLDQRHFTWGELAERAEPTKGYGTYWLDAIQESVLLVLDRKLPAVTTATFRALQTGNIFRPILYKVEKQGDTPRHFYVAFNREIEPELVGGPGNFGTAFNLLRVASRFRWEVAEPHLRRLSRVRSAEELDVFRRQLRETMWAIMDESERHQRITPETLQAVFREELRPLVGQVLEDWPRVEEVLVAPAGHGSLEEQRTELEAALQDLVRMNRQFMEWTACEYHAMLSAETPNA